MKPLATQPCITIRQEIGWTEKRTIEEKYEMQLYENKIICQKKEYLLKHVFDMSYRRATNTIGFLYLHTSQGVRSFYVKSNPNNFIEAFKELKQSYEGK